VWVQDFDREWYNSAVSWPAREGTRHVPTHGHDSCRNLFLNAGISLAEEEIFHDRSSAKHAALRTQRTGRVVYIARFQGWYSPGLIRHVIIIISCTYLARAV
jgi:hypothetical protein